jgi:hypothetical protein
MIFSQDSANIIDPNGDDAHILLMKPFIKTIGVNK